MQRMLGGALHAAKIFTEHGIVENAPGLALQQSHKMLPSTPLRRDFGTALFAKFMSTKATVISRKSLGELMNLPRAESYLRQVQNKLKYRNMSDKPDQESLLAIIGYTTNSALAAEINNALEGNFKFTDEERNDTLVKMGHAIQDAAIKLMPIQGEVALRNTTMSLADLKEKFPVGEIINGARLTSVALKDAPAYTGGNVDFVYHPKKENGIVDVSLLSPDFKNQEAEGLFFPMENRNWVADRYEEGQNGTRFGQHEDGYPSLTVHIKEV